MVEIDCNVELLLKNVCETIGEGPHFDPKRNELIFIDIRSSTYFRFNLETEKLERFQVEGPEPVSVIVPYESGNEDYVVSHGLKVCKLHWSNKHMTKLGETVNYGIADRFNDGKCDLRGRLWIGTMGIEKGPKEFDLNTARLYCLDDGKLTERDKPFSISNGIAWSADFKTMYYIDSIPRIVYKYDYDIEKGEISNRDNFIDFNQLPLEEAGFPDGMTIDKDENLWIAAYFGGKVIKFCGKTGKILGHIKIPALRTTSCCFGGPDHTTMFVTSAKYGWTDEEFKTKDPLAGSVFKVTGLLGVQGDPSFTFKE